MNNQKPNLVLARDENDYQEWAAVRAVLVSTKPASKKIAQAYGYCNDRVEEQKENEGNIPLILDSI